MRRLFASALLACLLCLGAGEASPQFFVPAFPTSSSGGGGACAGSGYRLCVHAVAGSIDTSNVTTSAIDTTGADLIIIAVSEFYATGTLIQLFYKQAPTVGSGHTFSCSDGAAYPAIAIVAFAGSIASPFDQQNTGSNAFASTAGGSGTVTPSNTNQLIFIGISTGTASTYSVDSGFSISDQISLSSGHNEGLAVAYLVQTAASAVAPTFTYTSSNNEAASMATFKSH